MSVQHGGPRAYGATRLSLSFPLYPHSCLFSSLGWFGSKSRPASRWRGGCGPTDHRPHHLGERASLPQGGQQRPGPDWSSQPSLPGTSLRPGPLLRPQGSHRRCPAPHLLSPPLLSLGSLTPWLAPPGLMSLGAPSAMMSAAQTCAALPDQAKPVPSHPPASSSQLSSSSSLEQNPSPLTLVPPSCPTSDDPQLPPAVPAGRTQNPKTSPDCSRESLLDLRSWSPCVRPHVCSTQSRWKESLKCQNPPGPLTQKTSVLLTTFKAKYSLMLLPFPLCPQGLAAMLAPSHAPARVRQTPASQPLPLSPP